MWSEQSLSPGIRVIFHLGDGRYFFVDMDYRLARPYGAVAPLCGFSLLVVEFFTRMVYNGNSN